MIFSFFKNIALIALLCDVFERRYPEEFKQFLINFSMYVIYLVTKCEIMLNKCVRALNVLIDNNPSLLSVKKYIYDLMKKIRRIDSELVYVKDGVVYNHHIIDNADFMIYSFTPDNNKDSSCISKKIIMNVEHSEINKTIHNYESSDIKFMLVELKIQEVSESTVTNESNDNSEDKEVSDGNNMNVTTYKIDLKTANYDFYVANNTLSKAFFKYCLRNMLNYTKEFKDGEKWSLKIIDHNADVVFVHFTVKNEELLIEKNSYTIKL